MWRRERDSNPRYAINVYTLSRRAPSATRPPLLLFIPSSPLAALCAAERGTDSQSLDTITHPFGAPALRCGVQSSFVRLSNPRYAINVYTLSRRAPSATRPPLLLFIPSSPLAALCAAERGTDSQSLDTITHPFGAPALRCGVQSSFVRLSNPRYAINVYTLSRRAPSATRPPLLLFIPSSPLAALCAAERGTDSQSLDTITHPFGAPTLRCGVQSSFVRLSNPRYAINVYTLSRRAPSATRPPLL